MSIHRRAAKRDSNEAEIIAVLKRAGCSVTQLSGRGVPDLLVGTPTPPQTLLLEVKAPGGKLTPDQHAWHDAWQGPPPFVVTTPAEALAAVLAYRHKPGRLLPEIE